MKQSPFYIAANFSPLRVILNDGLIVEVSLRAFEFPKLIGGDVVSGFYLDIGTHINCNRLVVITVGMLYQELKNEIGDDFFNNLYDRGDLSHDYPNLLNELKEFDRSENLKELLK